MNRYGERIDDSTVRFERMLPGPIERVWGYLTDADKRAKWLCGGVTEPQVGGKVEMLFHNSSLSNKPDIDPPEKYRDLPKKVAFGGTVTRYDPPRALSHTWDFENQQSEVCYELEAVDDKVRLVLTHRRLNSDNEVLAVSGGWHTHLDILEDVLEGREPEAYWKSHQPIEAEYERRYS
jgi:uncharacterized protein YndB with AHSA1/START domain